MTDERVKEEFAYDQMATEKFIVRMYNEFSREISRLKSMILVLQDEVERIKNGLETD